MELNDPRSALRKRLLVQPDLACALIDRHRRFSTRILAEVQARLSSLRDGVILTVERPEDFVGYDEALLSINQMMLTIGCIDARSGYDLSFQSGDEYIVTIPLRGSGWISTGGIFVEYGRDDVVIVAPLCRVEKHWDGPGEVVSIHVPVERFDRAMMNLGVETMPLAPVMRIDRRRLRSFLRLVDMIGQDLQDGEGPSPFLRSPLSEQTEEMLLTLLLEELSVAKSAKRELASVSPATPYYVRRAEKFIMANAHLAIGVEEIAKAAGVSVRTIQYGFREFCQTTPMQYLKTTRYHRAREILLMDCSSRKISDVALEIGCSNVSQFSRDYRLLFGETPSETMAATRRLVA